MQALVPVFSVPCQSTKANTFSIALLYHIHRLMPSNDRIARRFGAEEGNKGVWPDIYVTSEIEGIHHQSLEHVVVL